MIDATYKQVGIDFLLSDKYKFKYSGSFLKDNGFKEIYDLSENDEKEKINKRILQNLKKVMNFLLKKSKWIKNSLNHQLDIIKLA